ncbi:MAG: hypothetical protein HKM01_08175 [Gallionella sp.]|nr:hypothetical protein [Gallionella sp.]
MRKLIAMSDIVPHWWRAALTIVAIAGMSGCVSEPGHNNYFSEPNLPIHGRIDKAAEDTMAASLGADVLVFGRIRWFDNGEERTEYRSGWGWNVWLPFFRTQDKQFGLFVVEKDGTFTWRIPRGVYISNRLRWRDPWDGVHFINPSVAFEATDGANALCLGTLAVGLGSKRDIIGKLLIKSVQVRIDDDCETLSQQFHAKYTDPNLVAAKSLMRFDPRMPIPKELEERSNMQDFGLAISRSLMNLH